MQLQALISFFRRMFARLFPSTGSDGQGSSSSPAAPSPKSSSSLDWLTKERFREAAGLTTAKAEEFYGPIKAACIEFDINTPKRVAHFIAQTGHETGGFVWLREIWGPTPAQRRYEGRADLGNTKPGDGSRFRGRGLIHVTGRYNYQAVSDALGINFVAQPELLEHPEHAARASAYWWKSNGCNALADTGDVEAVTRRVNGGLNGLADRKARTVIAVRALQEVEGDLEQTV